MKKKITALITGIMLIATLIPAAAMAAVSPARTTLNPTKVYHGKEYIPIVSCTVTNNDPIIINGGRGKIYEVPFTESGLISVSLKNVRGAQSINIASGRKADLSDKWEESLDKGNSTDLTRCGKAGEKMYIAVYSKSKTFNVTMDSQVRLYPSADRTLSLNKAEYLGISSTKKSQTYKFKAKESGYIKVDADTAEDDVTFALLNKNKKQISKNYIQRYDLGEPIYFGVKKGETYYLRLKNVGGHEEAEAPYCLFLKNIKVKEKSGKTRKKAVTVKRNKQIKGYVLAGKKGTDWYKVKVKKTGKVSIKLQNYMTGQCYFDIYNNKGKKVKRLKYKAIEGDARITSKTKYGRLSKGTYYVKVYTKDKRESGGYSLKWK